MQQTNQEDYMIRPTRMHETATIISLQPISTTSLMCGQTA